MGNQLSLWNKYYGEGYIYSLSQSMGATLVKGFMELISLRGLFKKNKYSLIELGCGYGRDLIYFANYFNNLKMIGLDISDLGIELGNNLLQGSNKNAIELIKGDVREILERVINKERNLSHKLIIYTHYFLQIFLENDRENIGNLLLENLKEGDMIFINEYSINHSKVLSKDSKITPSSEENTYFIYPEESEHTVHFFKKGEIKNLLRFEKYKFYEEFEYLEEEYIKGDRIISKNWFVMIVI